MKIERNLLEQMTIKEFAERNDLTMEITERRESSSFLASFFASFKDCELSDHGKLISIYGDGNTEKEAINNCARRISCKILVFKAYTKDRKEIIVPKLTITE
jgi:hypothetical protein